MPVRLAGEEADALALERARQDHGGLAGGAARLGQRPEDLRHVVAVDGDGVPAEGLPAPLERGQVVFELGAAALAERVDVGDADQVVEREVLPGGGSFPHRPLGAFAVAHEHVGAVVGLQAARVQGAADAGAESLAERPGGDVDERQARRRVALEIGGELAEVEQVAARHEAGLGPRRVEQRRGMALRQHEAVGMLVLGVRGVVPHLGEEQRRHQIRRREAGGRMTAAGLGRGRDRLDAEPCRDVLQHRHDTGRLNTHAYSSSARV